LKAVKKSQITVAGKAPVAKTAQRPCQQAEEAGDAASGRQMNFQAGFC
jgi:hypothetical protein